MQKQSNLSGSVVEPARPQSNGAGIAYGPNGATNIMPTGHRAHHAEIAKTIAIAILGILSVTFLGLFVWKYFEWDTVRTDVDGQIDAAVAVAISENTTKLENEFVEREKYPYRTFSGPADYGSLSFEYPKTWSLYVEQDASNGGEYSAYLNPGEVQPVSANSINALRVRIITSAFDEEASHFDKLVESNQVTLTTRSVGGTLANVYSGELNTNLHGILAMFKLRDKTVFLQTDAMLFADEFYKLLDTVTFIQ